MLAPCSPIPTKCRKSNENERALASCSPIAYPPAKCRESNESSLSLSLSLSNEHERARASRSGIAGQVRGDVGKIYPARGSRIMAASSFEYA